MSHLGTNEQWVPPFASYFSLRTGILWAEWVEPGGSAGVELPDYVKQMIEDIAAFHSASIGSEEFNMRGSRLEENVVSNLLFIGTVAMVGPIYRRNALKNIRPFSIHGYEAANCPWRGTQWYLDEDG